MKIHTTNYFNTFIEVAEDCPASCGEIPKTKGDKRSIAEIQLDILKDKPYKFTSDEVLFQVFAERNDLTNSELEAAREAFFSKGQACFRASPLTKRYGFGVHADASGKIALYGCETVAYEAFLNDKSVVKVKAMRSKRVGK